ncbi:protein-tyrosine phosphatase [Kineococcus radiotolerans]|uniref:protein-tyrosine-phosphatase n=1 Tax=Kineococcus radiotolerans TaxID=131568 RepID=A0A7W4XY06_KINRA|nr:low molecular weight protein-tyrosine-phosphatase [Kineococcus radiotolerans]MBB2902042.1 protein-tyrosine phosphatase [Kineococcus radiotolerans]
MSTDPLRIMTVCTGNICRSPMAEVVLRERLASAGLADRVVVDSSGISDEEEGNPIDRRAASVLREHGYEVPAHRAHQATAEEIGQRDLLLAMTSRHARWLRTQAPDEASAGRVAMYRSFDPAAPGLDARDGGGVDESDLDIEDPWYGDRTDFERTLEQVEAAADAVVAHVRERLDGAGRAPGTSSRS